MSHRRLFQVLLTCSIALVVGSVNAAEPVRREWTIDGTAREALVCVPDGAKEKPAPLVFVFHGHGGTMHAMLRRYHLQQLWPEAIVVYPQGLNTPGRLTDRKEKKPRLAAQREHGEDRDLKYFDAVLADLKKDYKVDDKRIYSTGHSNGGGYVFIMGRTGSRIRRGRRRPLPPRRGKSPKSSSRNRRFTGR